MALLDASDVFNCAPKLRIQYRTYAIVMLTYNGPASKIASRFAKKTNFPINGKDRKFYLESVPDDAAHVVAHARLPLCGKGRRVRKLPAGVRVVRQGEPEGERSSFITIFI